MSNVQVEEYPALRAPGFGSQGSHCTLCGPFLNIEPLIDLPEGRYINPLFDVVKTFELGLEPNPLLLVPGQTFDAQLTAQAEENHYGDFLGADLLADLTTGAGQIVDGTAANSTELLAIQMFSQQNDLAFMNSPVIDRFVFSNGQLRNNLAACFLIQATNFIQVRVQNISPLQELQLRMFASGRRLLPYQYPGLRDQFLAYWNAQRSIPYWLTFDTVLSATDGGGGIPGSGLRINPGETVSAVMTVPGMGDFQAIYRMALINGVGGDADARNVELRVSEGVGRAVMSRFVPLSLYAQPLTNVAGFQDGEFRPASGNHAKYFSQFFKRQTRVRFEVRNNNNVPIDFYFAYHGVQHYYDECAPGRGLQGYSLEPTVGPQLVQSPRCPPVHAFEPVPGQGLQPINPNPVPLLPPTGFTPPVAMPNTGQRISAPALPPPANGNGVVPPGDGLVMDQNGMVYDAEGNPLNGMSGAGGTSFYSNDFGIG